KVVYAPTNPTGKRNRQPEAMPARAAAAEKNTAMAKQPVTLMNSVPYGQPVPNRLEKESPTTNRATAPAAPPQATSRMAVPRPTARHVTRCLRSAAQQTFGFQRRVDRRSGRHALQVRLERGPAAQVD